MSSVAAMNAARQKRRMTAGTGANLTVSQSTASARSITPTPSSASASAASNSNPIDSDKRKSLSDNNSSIPVKMASPAIKPIPAPSDPIDSDGETDDPLDSLLTRNKSSTNTAAAMDPAPVINPLSLDNLFETSFTFQFDNLAKVLHHLVNELNTMKKQQSAELREFNSRLINIESIAPSVLTLQKQYRLSNNTINSIETDQNLFNNKLNQLESSIANITIQAQSIQNQAQQAIQTANQATTIANAANNRANMAANNNNRIVRMGESRRASLVAAAPAPVTATANTDSSNPPVIANVSGNATPNRPNARSAAVSPTAASRRVAESDSNNTTDVSNTVRVPSPQPAPINPSTTEQLLIINSPSQSPSPSPSNPNITVPNNPSVTESLIPAISRHVSVSSNSGTDIVDTIQSTIEPISASPSQSKLQTVQYTESNSKPSINVSNDAYNDLLSRVISIENQLRSNRRVTSEMESRQTRMLLESAKLQAMMADIRNQSNQPNNNNINTDKPIINTNSSTAATATTTATATVSSPVQTNSNAGSTVLNSIQQSNRIDLDHHSSLVESLESKLQTQEQIDAIYETAQSSADSAADAADKAQIASNSAATAVDAAEEAQIALQAVRILAQQMQKAINNQTTANNSNENTINSPSNDNTAIHRLSNSETTAAATAATAISVSSTAGPANMPALSSINNLYSPIELPSIVTIAEFERVKAMAELAVRRTGQHTEFLAMQRDIKENNNTNPNSPYNPNNISPRNYNPSSSSLIDSDQLKQSILSLNSRTLYIEEQLDTLNSLALAQRKQSLQSGISPGNISYGSGIGIDANSITEVSTHLRTMNLRLYELESKQSEYTSKIQLLASLLSKQELQSKSTENELNEAKNQIGTESIEIRSILNNLQSDNIHLTNNQPLNLIENSILNNQSKQHQIFLTEQLESRLIEINKLKELVDSLIDLDIEQRFELFERRFNTELAYIKGIVSTKTDIGNVRILLDQAAIAQQQSVIIHNSGTGSGSGSGGGSIPGIDNNNKISVRSIVNRTQSQLITLLQSKADSTSLRRLEDYIKTLESEIRTNLDRVQHKIQKHTRQANQNQQQQQQQHQPQSPQKSHNQQQQPSVTTPNSASRPYSRGNILGLSSVIPLNDQNNSLVNERLSDLQSQIALLHIQLNRKADKSTANNDTSTRPSSISAGTGSGSGTAPPTVDNNNSNSNSIESQLERAQSMILYQSKQLKNHREWIAKHASELTAVKEFMSLIQYQQQQQQGNQSILPAIGLFNTTNNNTPAIFQLIKQLESELISIRKLVKSKVNYGDLGISNNSNNDNNTIPIINPHPALEDLRRIIVLLSPQLSTPAATATYLHHINSGSNSANFPLLGSSGTKGDYYQPKSTAITNSLNSIVPASGLAGTAMRKLIAGATINNLYPAVNNTNDTELTIQSSRQYHHHQQHQPRPPNNENSEAKQQQQSLTSRSNKPKSSTSRNSSRSGGILQQSTSTGAIDTATTVPQSNPTIANW